MTLALVTLEDRRAVYALLDRYLDWLPPTRLSLQRAEATKNDGAGQWRRCEVCAGTGRVAGQGRSRKPCRLDHGHWPYAHRCQPCPAVCERGLIRLHGKDAETGLDPMLRPGKDDLVSDSNARFARWRYVDAQLVKLAALERQRSGVEAAPDEMTRAHDAKERQWRTGSFRPLELALELLAVTAPLRMEALRVYVIEQHFDPEYDVRARLDEIVDWLAARLPRPILLPADAAAELTVWKRSLEHGRTQAHAAQRRLRDEQLAMLVDEHGWSLRRAGRVFDLSHTRVAAIVAAQAAEQTVVASGPAA